MSKKVKLVCGVGINDADYKVTDSKWEGGKCPYYQKWVSMLVRCYSTTYLNKRPTYRGCTVCGKWLTFSNFKQWMEQQGWEGKHLDKDLLVEGNKVYSPDTCVFMTNELNSFIRTRGRGESSYPTGVCVSVDHPTRYLSRIMANGKLTHLGTFDTPEEAHLAWQRAKLSLAKDYLAEETDPRIQQGLTRIINKLEYHIEHGIETKDL